MKVVLIKSQEKLGNVGDIVNVKDGYAINFLIPKGIAVVGTEDAIVMAKKGMIQKKKEKKQIEKKIHDTSVSVQNRKFKMSAKTSSGGRTYDSISKEDIEKVISDSLNKKGGEIKVELDLPQPIKEVGKYSLDVIFKSPEKEEKTEIILDVVSE